MADGRMSTLDVQIFPHGFQDMDWVIDELLEAISFFSEMGTICSTYLESGAKIRLDYSMI